MGLVNPFFEKADMKAFTAKTPKRCVQLIEALSTVGIEEHQFIDADFVQRKIDQLTKEKAEFLEFEIRHFLQCYGKRRTMPPGLERTRFILTKLTERPVYYIWFNPNLKFSA